MNVNAINGGSYAAQVASAGTEKKRAAPPPVPPGVQPPDAGGFVSAIDEALQSLGVTDVAAGDRDKAASALGGFLQELMASLHEQGTANAAQAEGPGSAGGPGRLAQDSLGADSSDAQTKLASFLQTLSAKLPQSGSTGNLVNTTA